MSKKWQQSGYAFLDIDEATYYIENDLSLDTLYKNTKEKYERNKDMS